MKGVKKIKINWDQFQKYFKEKYLSIRYYDNKRKEIQELNLGKNSMEENVKKFMELLRYVDYIKEERVKIQIFLGGLPYNYRDRIEFVDPKILEETIKMVTRCFDQGKGKEEV